MKIAFFEIHDQEKEFFQKRLSRHTLSFNTGPLTTSNVSKAKNCDIISVFTASKINEEVLSKIPSLKLITTRSTGYDHIGVASCKKRGIFVTNVPKYGENTVAEHTFALLLAASRNIHKAYDKTSKNDFTLSGLQGFDLKGKTIGIMGLGSIGMHVLRIAKGFEMSVLVNTRKQDKTLAKKLGFSYVTLHDLFRKSDIITLHIPLTQETKHIINANAFSKMKKGVVIVNTSRGALIDTKALIKALDNKIVSYAALDVLEGEDILKEEHELLHNPRKRAEYVAAARGHTLLKYSNVIFTPHIGFYSKEAVQRILDTTADTILSFTSKKYRLLKSVSYQSL